jgi:hypothetical protein
MRKPPEITGQGLLKLQHNEVVVSLYPARHYYLSRSEVSQAIFIVIRHLTPQTVRLAHSLYTTAWKGADVYPDQNSEV